MKREKEIVLKEKLRQKGIEIESYINRAGNSVRFFRHCEQEIYFDTQTEREGTTFNWDCEEVENLLLIIEHIKEYKQPIYYGCADDKECFEIKFRWGIEPCLSPIFFDGWWDFEDGKVIKYI